MVRGQKISGLPRISEERNATCSSPKNPSGSNRKKLQSMKCIFSVDVEDWFHILDLPSTPSLGEWDALPSHVEKNFLRLLELFGQKEVRITCFFLGWVAAKYPHLVRAAQDLGHEIASHGFAHRLMYKMTPAEFFEDATRAKKVIEDIIGQKIIGYRASGFSVTSETPWFFEKLLEAGYRYDSSIFPLRRGHGGFRGAKWAPHFVQVGSDHLLEFPITLTKILNTPVCLFGGGYLRLAPWALIKRGATKVLGEGRPVIFYLHPREIDPDQPRLDMTYLRRFKSYVNLNSTENKVKRILEAFQFTTFAECMAELQPRRAHVAGDGR
jgi:polysaccharide deacetylase family protein (PEP-CTERM system associated)